MTLKQNPERLAFIKARRAEIPTLDGVVSPRAVIGTFGIGIEWDPDAGCYLRMPQVGGVDIHPNVSISAGTVIQRGAVDDTVIGEGTHIGSLVLIGHGCQIGKHVFIAGGAKLKGSLVIGDRAVIGMGAVVLADVPEDGFVRAGSVWE